MPTPLALPIALVMAALPLESALPHDPEPSRRQISVDLANQVLVGRLPFDVEFDFTGNLPGDTRRLEVVWWDVTEAMKGCSKPKSRSKDPAARAIDENTCRTRIYEHNPPKSEILGQRLWQPGGLATGSDFKFVIPISALEAEHSYVFRFIVSRSVGVTRMDAYRAALRSALDTVFTGVTNDDLTLEQVEAIRLRARGLLERLLGAYEVVARDPVFSPEVPASDALSAFAELVNAPILLPLRDRATVLANDYPSAATELEARLTTLSRSGPLARLIAAARSDADIVKVLVEHKPATDLIGLDPTEIRPLAQGKETLLSADLGQATTLGEVDGFTGRYRALLDRVIDLRKLSSLIVRVDGPYAEQVKKLIKDKKLTAADLGAVRALVDDAGHIASLLGTLQEALSAVDRIHQNFQSVQTGLEALTRRIELSVQNIAVVGANTYGDFNTFYPDHTSLDAGFIYAFGMDAVVPYLGTNIYFRPVNRDAPLGLKAGPLRRISLTVGLTVKSVADTRRTRSDLFGSQAGVIGIGARARESIRLMVGLLIFHKKETSPLRSGTSLTSDPFFALSFDVDVAKIPGIFGGVFK